MALTQPHADYTSALASGMAEDYLVLLHYYDSDGGGSTGQIGISLNSTASITFNSISTSFTPALMSPPVIREKIDLKSYTSSVGNVSLTIADFATSLSTFPLTNSAGLVSGEFHFNNGNRYYINQKVEIYSMLNASNDASKCLKIFEGRLADVQQNWMGKTIKLQVTSYNPFDHIMIPITRDTEENTPAPITYGSYTPNTYNDYATSVDLWKAPILNKGRNGFVRALLRDETISADAYPHIWDEILEKFIPIGINSSGSLDSASEAYNGINIGYADKRLFRIVKAKPFEVTGTGTNLANAYDTPNANESSTAGTTQNAGVSATGSQQSVTDTNEIVTYSLPQLSGRPTAYTIDIVYKLKGSADSGVSFSDATIQLDARIDDTTFSTGANNAVWNMSTNELSMSDGSGADTATSSLITQTLTVAVASADGYPETLSLRTVGVFDEFDGSGNLKHYAEIYDIRITATCSVDLSQSNNNLQSGMREILGLDYLYCGADGYTQSFATSTLVTTIVDMHRDLIYRFGGVTATPTDWSTLDSARSNYTVTYSDFREKTLQQLLNMCQFEGNFIFRTDCQGNYKYINPHPSSNGATSTSSGNLVFSIAEINNLQFKMSPLSDVVTKIKMKYDKHPATDKWQAISTVTNTTPRTRYNFGTLANENTQELDFNILNNSTGISEWKTRRFAHFGEPKLHASFDIVHPKYYYLEVGDKFQFNADVGYVFNSDIGNDEVGFLITETKRTIGKISVKAVYLGEA